MKVTNTEIVSAPVLPCQGASHDHMLRPEFIQLELTCSDASFGNQSTRGILTAIACAFLVLFVSKTAFAQGGKEDLYPGEKLGIDENCGPIVPYIEQVIAMMDSPNFNDREAATNFLRNSLQLCLKQGSCTENDAYMCLLAIGHQTKSAEVRHRVSILRDKNLLFTYGSCSVTCYLLDEKGVLVKKPMATIRFTGSIDSAIRLCRDEVLAPIIDLHPSARIDPYRTLLSAACRPEKEPSEQ